MNRLSLIVAAGISIAGLANAAAAEVRLGSHTFTIPDGFEIEQVAGPPLVDRPIVADFDDMGRLYVADSSGSNDKVEKQLAEKPHRIVRLEDTNDDGRFDTSTVFADKMMFPEGALWYDGSLYVAAPPSIWKLADADGDGVAEQRQEWFQGKTLTGCANDLHGPYLGPDGWIYWCKGAFARQEYERPGRLPFVTRAAHIFRCRPDGLDIEPVMTGGMDNPVEVVFTPGGERIFTTTFLQRPGNGLRDGLIHAIYGGIYGKVNDAVDEHPHTGDLMPVLTHLGPAAPCGLARYQSRVFGAEYQGNLFASLFNLHKVTRHVLEPDGATFETRDEDFLVSDNLDFHPTDVLEDADGSLIVINTGGWYKLCCPTSQLWKPDVLGAIYRVRRKNATPPGDPRGKQLVWSKLRADRLCALLGDARPAVRKRAMHELARKGAIALPVLARMLENASSAQARCRAVWTLARIDHAQARALVRAELGATDEETCQAAIHAASVWRDVDAVPQLVGLLQSESLHHRRAAAEALGRMGKRAAIAPLLAAAATPHDRVLEHSLIYALIEIAHPAATATGLQSANPHTRRAALIALDQMPGGTLDPLDVAALLSASDPLIKETAAWIVERHADWGDALGRFFRERLAAAELDEADRSDLERHLARLARAESVQQLLTESLVDASLPHVARRAALRAMAQSGLKEAPASWASAMAQILASDDAALVHEAVFTARSLAVRDEDGAALAKGLKAVACDAQQPADVRLAALAAMPGGLAEVEPDVFDFLRASLSPELALSSRIAAADVLSQAKLSGTQLVALCESLKTVGPLEAGRIVEAFAECSDAEIGQRLVTAIEESLARRGLRVDTLKTILSKFPPAVHERAEAVYTLMNLDASHERERLDTLLASLHDGDIRRGQLVFNSTKAACAACHAIGYMGGNSGPDLTRIGQIRADRDLLEAIVFPNASFVRSYEPVSVVTAQGKIFNGVLRNDAVDGIVLATGPKEEVRIAREDIEGINPSQVSIMPSGLDQQLSPQDLADLVTFLKACK